MSEIYSKVCQECNIAFETEKKRKKFCKKCIDKRYRINKGYDYCKRYYQEKIKTNPDKYAKLLEDNRKRYRDTRVKQTSLTNLISNDIKL